MKKKTVKKLVLAKETIARLSEAEMQNVWGAQDVTQTPRCISNLFYENPDNCAGSADC